MSSEIAKMKEFVDGLKELRADLRNENFAKKIGENATSIVSQHINKIFFSCVEEFYNSYAPKEYGRTGSLYQTWRVETRNKYCVRYISDSSLMMGAHRVNNEYIYDLMFSEGWHGGANAGRSHPNPGTPYYRKPSRKTVIASGGRPYMRWGRIAERSDESPKDKISKNLELYQNGISEVGGFSLNNDMLSARNKVWNSYSLIQKFGGGGN